MYYGRNINGDTFYIGTFRRGVYIRICGMFQIAIFWFILSLKFADKWDYMYIDTENPDSGLVKKNYWFAYFVVPHKSGATHSLRIFKFRITLVINKGEP